MRNTFAERPHAEGRELEVLHGERDTDDRDRTRQCECQVGERDPESGAHKPQKIEYKRGLTRRMIFYDLPTERHEREIGELEALHAKWREYHGEAEHDSDEQVLDAGEQAAAEDDPDQISQEAHVRSQRSTVQRSGQMSVRAGVYLPDHAGFGERE